MNCAKCRAPGICVCGEAYNTQEAIRHEPLPLAVRLRDETGPPLPQMIAQRRAQLAAVICECSDPCYPDPNGDCPQHGGNS